MCDKVSERKQHKKCRIYLLCMFTLETVKKVHKYSSKLSKCGCPFTSVTVRQDGYKAESDSSYIKFTMSLWIIWREKTLRSPSESKIYFQNYVPQTPLPAEAFSPQIRSSRNSLLSLHYFRCYSLYGEASNKLTSVMLLCCDSYHTLYR